MPEDHRSC